MLRADAKGRHGGYKKNLAKTPKGILICWLRVIEVLAVVGGVAQTHDQKRTSLSHRQPPNADTSNPVWVAHEMVLEDHQLAYFCNGLIKAIAARPKSRQARQR